MDFIFKVGYSRAALTLDSLLILLARKKVGHNSWENLNSFENFSLAK